MPRYANPLASPYPTDPAFGAAADSLATALFGDPELRARVQLRRAQMEEMAAQAERARAGAAYDTERTRGVRGQNDVVLGEGPGSLARVITDPLFLAASRAHPEGLTLEGVNNMRYGSYLKQLIDQRLPPPQQSPLADAVTQPPEGRAGEYDPTSNVITVGGDKPAPPPELPPLNEDTLRLIGALGGKMPSENTAYTTGFSLQRQGNELGNKIAIENIQSRDRRYAANSSAGAAMYGDRLQFKATTRGQNMTDSRERGLGTFGPNAGGNKPVGSEGGKFLNKSDTDNLRGEVNAQLPFTVDNSNAAGLREAVTNRASQLLTSGQARSVIEAVTRAKQELNVKYIPAEEGGYFGASRGAGFSWNKNANPDADPLGIRR